MKQFAQVLGVPYSAVSGVENGMYTKFPLHMAEGHDTPGDGLRGDAGCIHRLAIQARRCHHGRGCSMAQATATDGGKILAVERINPLPPSRKPARRDGLMSFASNP